MPSSGWINPRGYHQRDIVEEMIRQLVPGDITKSRNLARHLTEAHIAATEVDTNAWLGMPGSIQAGQIKPAT